MKIYFIHDSNLSDSLKTSVEEFLIRQGYIVSSRKYTVNSESANFEDSKKIFSNNLKNLKAADIIVAEGSYHSSGVGYEVSLALEEKKPVILIYNMSEDKSNPHHIDRIPIIYKGNSSRYLIVKEYDMRNLNKTLELALKDSRDLVDTKFILIIPPEIDKYLEWNSKQRGKAKAEVTREAIERIMEGDTKYHAYLKENEISE